MNVRHAISDDSAAIFRLVNQLHPSMSVEQDAFQNTFELILQRSESVCLVVSDNENLLGYISGNVRPVLIQGGNVAFIDEIVVESGMRGKSLGTMLMEHFEYWAQREKCTLIGLATAGAESFYVQLGFQSKAGYFKKYVG